MKKTIFGLAALALCACSSQQQDEKEVILKDVFAGKFTIGAAINLDQIYGRDSLGQATFLKHFNSAEAENCMKCEVIHPEKDRYFWDDTDAFVDLCEKNGIEVIGHCLIWHSQCAPWFPVDEDGNDVSPEELTNRMRDHIYTIVGRYKGRVKGWDVVNETIVEDGSYRNSKFYQILGEEFIPLAFQFAHEADPDAELYINDYGMANPNRREGTLRVIRQLKDRGLRIDGVGMQGHNGMDYPDYAEFTKSLEAFAAETGKVMITEWDMSALPTIHQSANVGDSFEYSEAYNPYPDELPDSVSQAWNARAKEFFQILLDHADVVDRINVWGVQDGDSWKNDYPMEGRKEYPLLFDRQYQMKPFLKEIAAELSNNQSKE